MPTTIQGFLILLFVLPGFLAVELDAQIRPARERSLFDKTVLCVLFSSLVHVVLILAWTYVAEVRLGLDLAVVTEAWISQQFRDHPLRTEGFVCGYFASSMLAGWVVGGGLSKLNRGIAPVWARETYLRVRRKGWLDRFMVWRQRRKFNKAVSVLVKMKSGDQYAGILRSVPGEYSELQQKDKYFSIARAVFLPKEGVLQALEEQQVVLLNMADVESLFIGEEPLV